MLGNDSANVQRVEFLSNKKQEYDCLNLLDSHKLIDTQWNDVKAHDIYLAPTNETSFPLQWIAPI